MKKFIYSILVMLCIATTSLVAQIQFNPQIGVNFTDLSVDPSVGLGQNFETEGEAGLMLGVDFRFGERFYIQPGLFVVGSKVVYSIDGVISGESEITRYGAKLKGQLGYKIIDDEFKLRVSGGPSYDFQLSLDDEGSIYFNEDEFKTGIFGIDAAVGVDILFLTAEVGYSWALTDTFDEDFFENKPKYQSIYFTLGVVIGE